MGYSAPQDENKYKPVRPGVGYPDQPTPTDSQSERSLWGGLDQMTPLSEFEDAITPRQEEPIPRDIPIFEPPPEDEPTLLANDTEDQPLGSPQLKPTDVPIGPIIDPRTGKDEGNQSGLFDPRKEGAGPQPFDESDAATYAQRIFDQGYRPKDLRLINVQQSETDPTWLEKVYDALTELETAERKQATEDIENALTASNEDWFEVDGTKFGLDEANKLAINRDNGDVWIWDPETKTYEKWEGEDRPKLDALEAALKEAQGEEEEGDGSLETDSAALKEILALAGNPTAEDLKAWADRRSKDSSEIQPNNERWWWGILAKELGITDVYHRPYTSVPSGWDEIIKLDPSIDWTKYYS